MVEYLKSSLAREEQTDIGNSIEGGMFAKPSNKSLWPVPKIPLDAMIRKGFVYQTIELLSSLS